ncbi:MAG: TIGR00725 family protein, partial [Pseudomonadota bacterium]
MMRRIGVIGNSACSDEVINLAEKVGEEVAKRKGILICGGLTGVMEGAARGAKKAGGLTVGILPGNRDSDANPFIDIPIVTGLGYARNIIVVQSSEVVIAIGGKYGTLSEIAYALQFNIPVVGLQTWDISPEIIIASNP